MIRYYQSRSEAKDARLGLRQTGTHRIIRIKNNNEDGKYKFQVIEDKHRHMRGQKTAHLKLVKVEGINWPLKNEGWLE